MEKKLYRDERHKTVGGVCAGLAEYFNVDVSVVRVVFVLAVFLKGVGILPYIVLWIVLPKRPFNYNDPTFKPGVTPGYNPNYGHGFRDVHVDYTVPPPPMPGQPFTPYTPKKSSNVGVVFGMILIGLGAIFLLDEFDIIPDWDFEKLWPVILVAIGATLLFGSKKQPWEKEGWHAEKKEADFTAETKAEATDEQSNDNPTTV
ncbi:PspC domain-containing protein [Mucilaginibacter sp. 14171R-50]|uniref:PspC domain-containing protein n=1 Tax=Mucilaginibacter sp. 14171R-50 TaxID=2703789 RepID=UPI00138D6DEE|nr:PspC domain-containing protein [Mucilaginibacter sp. 14171R-50]QHS55530.1 PspC domain-containing protein [Mucilaginibacter sp. 14171R-50]